MKISFNNLLIGYIYLYIILTSESIYFLLYHNKQKEKLNGFSNKGLVRLRKDLGLRQLTFVRNNSSTKLNKIVGTKSSTLQYASYVQEVCRETKANKFPVFFGLGEITAIDNIYEFLKTDCKQFSVDKMNFKVSGYIFYTAKIAVTKRWIL